MTSAGSAINTLKIMQKRFLISCLLVLTSPLPSGKHCQMGRHDNLTLPLTTVPAGDRDRTLESRRIIGNSRSASPYSLPEAEAGALDARPPPATRSAPRCRVARHRDRHFCRVFFTVRFESQTRSWLFTQEGGGGGGGGDQFELADFSSECTHRARPPTSHSSSDRTSPYPSPMHTAAAPAGVWRTGGLGDHNNLAVAGPSKTHVLGDPKICRAPSNVGGAREEAEPAAGEQAALFSGRAYAHENSSASFRKLPRQRNRANKQNK